MHRCYTAFCTRCYHNMHYAILPQCIHNIYCLKLLLQSDRVGAFLLQNPSYRKNVQATHLNTFFCVFKGRRLGWDFTLVAFDSGFKNSFSKVVMNHKRLYIINCWVFWNLGSGFFPLIVSTKIWVQCDPFSYF